MRGPFRNVKLKILSNGQTLQLYDDPDAEDVAGERHRSRYVEAITGAKFEIQVALKGDYDISRLQNDDCVRVLVHYDGSSTGWHQTLSKYEIERQRNRSQIPTTTLSSTTRVDPATGQYLDGDTTFGALTLSK